MQKTQSQDKEGYTASQKPLTNKHVRNCPSCGGRLVFAEASFYCPNCGYSPSCGFGEVDVRVEPERGESLEKLQNAKPSA